MIRLFVAFTFVGAASAAEAQILEEILVVPSDGSILGKISDVDLLPDGRVVVLDSQAKSVFIYSQEGSLALELGGPGEGPGEIALGVEVEVGPEGEIMVVDPGNSRLTYWDSDGSLGGSSRFGALLGSAALWPHELLWNESGITLKTSHFIPDEPILFYAISSALEGPAELLASISMGPSSVTCVFCPTTKDSSGRLVVARGDTLYQVERLDTSGRSTLQWSRRDLPAARRSEEELGRLNAASRRMRASEGGGGESGFSEFKTRFGPHSLDF